MFWPKIRTLARPALRSEFEFDLKWSGGIWLQPWALLKRCELYVVCYQLIIGRFIWIFIHRNWMISISSDDKNHLRSKHLFIVLFSTPRICEISMKTCRWSRYGWRRRGGCCGWTIILIRFSHSILLLLFLLQYRAIPLPILWEKNCEENITPVSDSEAPIRVFFFFFS